MTRLSSTRPEVVLNLRPFSPDRPTIWVAQTEAQVDLAAITCQGIKYNYVVSQLSEEQAAEVEDIILLSPKYKPYNLLKAELMRLFAISRKKRVIRLALGNGRPETIAVPLASQGLPLDITYHFLHPILAIRLTPHAEAMLACLAEGSLDSADHLADYFFVVTPQPTTAIVSPAKPNNSALLLERI